MSTYHHPTTIDEQCKWAAGRLGGKDWVYWGFFGEPGSFKSSTMLMLAKKIQAITRPDIPFDPRRQVVRSSAEYAVARRVTPAKCIIVRDEGIKSGANKMRFMSGENNDTVEDVNTGRKLYHGVLEAVPFADDVDPRLFKHFHHTWRFTDKGVGKVFECRKIGFKKTKVWEEPRFGFRVKHCAVADPPLWEAYMEEAVDDVRGLRADLLAREERLHMHEASARNLLL